MVVPIDVSIPFMNLTEAFQPPVTNLISYPITCRNKTLTHFKCLTSRQPSPKTLTHFKCLTSPQPSPSTLHSDSTSFQVSYLINKFDFSPQTASKICSTHRLSFKTSQKPDSVINFFTNYGFSNSQLRRIIAKAPWLLSCNLSKRVLPKFEFFISKGASNSDVVNLVSNSPAVLCPSLENHIAPTYDLVYTFLQSHKDTIACAIYNSCFLHHRKVPENIRLLIENGVADANIALILRNRTQTLWAPDMVNLVDELKDLGFNPSKTTFGVALIAKTLLYKTRWKEKVDAFKKWGWSDEDVIEAFKKKPYCMITSIDKIDLVMNFWVNQLGWDALALTNRPTVLSLSLEKRIIPRASVVQFLLNNGLRNKNASLTFPFEVPEKRFLDRYIKRFEEESSYLLNLYEEKLNLACHD